MTVILACLTTCIGLVNACATFTKKHVPKFSYKIFALVFYHRIFIYNTWFRNDFKNCCTIVTLIYPESIALVLISFANMFSTFRFSWAYRLATLTLIISILQILNSFNLLRCYFEIVYDVTFSRYRFSLACTIMLFAIIGFIIDVLIRRPKQRQLNKCSLPSND